MADGRGWRFALEVAFLVALAVVLGIANVGTGIIIAVMLAGWVLVALLEWAAWREEPHWTSGSPPSYYVPPVEIPPRRVIDQGYKVEQGYPAQREPEAPTWIATPEMRAAALEEWPVPPPAAEPDEAVAESPVSAAPAVEPMAEPPVEKPPVAEPVEEPPVFVPPPVTAQAPAEAPAPADPEPAEEPLADALLHEAAAAVNLDDSSAVEDVLDDPHEPGDGNGSDPWEVQSFPDGADEGVRTSSHRIDPLAEPDGRRWPWQRRADGVDAGATEFPARPRHVLLPQHGESRPSGDER